MHTYLLTTYIRLSFALFYIKDNYLISISLFLYFWVCKMNSSSYALQFAWTSSVNIFLQVNILCIISQTFIFMFILWFSEFSVSKNIAMSNCQSNDILLLNQHQSDIYSHFDIEVIFQSFGLFDFYSVIFLQNESTKNYMHILHSFMGGYGKMHKYVKTTTSLWIHS